MNNKNFFTTYDGSKINFLPCLVNHKLNKEIPTYHLDNETKAKKNMFSHLNGKSLLPFSFMWHVDKVN